jgi:hypothetical protein
VTDEVLTAAHRLASEWLGTLAERTVRAAGEPDGLRAPRPPRPAWSPAPVRATSAS